MLSVRLLPMLWLSVVCSSNCCCCSDCCLWFSVVVVITKHLLLWLWANKSTGWLGMCSICHATHIPHPHPKLVHLPAVFWERSNNRTWKRAQKYAALFAKMTFDARRPRGPLVLLLSLAYIYMCSLYECECKSPSVCVYMCVSGRG